MFGDEQPEDSDKDHWWEVFQSLIDNRELTPSQIADLTVPQLTFYMGKPKLTMSQTITLARFRKARAKARKGN